MVWILIVACLTIAQVQCKTHSTLKLVEVLFRHGDRSPTILYPGDPNPPEVWREGLGMLTILGRKQHYGLGKFLRINYNDFITSDPKEVYVNSNDLDRCIRSAECHLAGLYEPTPLWSFDKNIPWQPIPIVVLPVNDDQLNHESDCPAAFKEDARIETMPLCQKLLKDNKKMLNFLSEKSGMDLTTTGDVDDFYDTLTIEKKYKLVTPLWVLPYWDALTKFDQKSLLCKYPSPLIQRLRAGPHLEKIIDDMKLKIAGDLPDLKIQVYSIQEHNIEILLSALNIFNMKRPPYCATIIIELHEMDPGQNAIRILYLNSTTPELGFQVPNVLTIDGCSEYCPFEFFANFTRHLIPDDWKKECGL